MHALDGATGDDVNTTYENGDGTPDSVLQAGGDAMVASLVATGNAGFGAQNLFDFGVGVLQGIASSMTFGYVGGPSANDSDASIAGQITGTGIAGASGGLLQNAGTGAMGVGLVAEVQ